jgi:hypothetical protein
MSLTWSAKFDWFDYCLPICSMTSKYFIKVRRQSRPRQNSRSRRSIWKQNFANLTNMSTDLNLDQGDVYKSKYNFADLIYSISAKFDRLNSIC